MDILVSTHTFAVEICQNKSDLVYVNCVQKWPFFPFLCSGHRSVFSVLGNIRTEWMFWFLKPYVLHILQQSRGAGGYRMDGDTWE